MKLYKTSPAIFNNAVFQTFNNEKFMGYCSKDEIVKKENEYVTPYGTVSLKNKKTANVVEFRRLRGSTSYKFSNMNELERFVEQVLKGEIW